jgi:hypothetical protein
MDAETRKRVLRAYEKIGLVSPVKEGAVAELGQAFGAGILDVAGGLGATATELEMGTGLEEAVASARRTHRHWDAYEGYDPASFELTNVARTVGRAVPTTVSSVAVGAGIGALTANPAIGAAASAAFMTSTEYGETKRYFKDSGMTEGDANILAALSSIAVGATEVVGGPELGLIKNASRTAARETAEAIIKKYGKRGLKEFGQYLATGAVKGGAGEIAEEVVQHYTKELFRYTGSGQFQNLDADQFRQIAIAAGLPGALLGGAGEVTTALRTGRVADQIIAEREYLRNRFTSEEIIRDPDLLADAIYDEAVLQGSPETEATLEQAISLSEEAVASDQETADFASERFKDTFGIDQVKTTPEAIAEEMPEDVIEPVADVDEETVAGEPEEATEITERARIAIPTKEKQTRQFLKDVYDTTKVEKQTVKEWNEQADKLLIADKDFETKLKEGKIDRANPVVQVAASKLNIKKAGKAFNKDGSVNEEAFAEAESTAKDYETMRTQTARALTAIRDPLHGIEAKNVKDVLDAFVVDATRSRAKQLQRTMTVQESAKYAQNLREKISSDLSKKGVDINDIQETGVLSVKDKNALIDAISTETSSISDKFYEFWINGLLSLPSTHIGNIISNTAHGIYDIYVRRGAEASINLLFRNKEAATFGELGHLFKRFFPMIGTGFKDMFSALRSDFTGTMDSAKFDKAYRPAIKGKKGDIIRTPTRALFVADEIAKRIFTELETISYAHRQARKSGLKTKSDIDSYVLKELKNPSSGSAEYAKLRSKELTFQSDPGVFVKKLMNLRDTIPGLRYIIPFIKTPANIAKISLRDFTPIGTLNALYKLKKGDKAGSIRDVSAQLVSFGAMAFVYGMLGGDDEEPSITGSRPDWRNRGKTGFARRALPPTSIKIAGRWYDYSRLEPFGSAIKRMVDGLDAFKKRGAGAGFVKALKSSVDISVNDLWLNNLAELVSTVQSNDEDKAVRFAGNFLQSWIPNAVKSPVKALQGPMRDNRSFEKGTFENMQFQLFELPASKVGVIQLTPKYDLWGNTIPTSTDYNPLGNFMWSIIVPSKTKAAERLPGRERILFNWNKKQKSEEDQYWPQVPAWYYKKDGKNVYMSREEYAKYAERAGKYSKAAIDEAIQTGRLNVNNPTVNDIEIYKNIISKERSRAKTELLLTK